MNLTRLKEQDYDLVLTTNETLNFISDLEGFLIDEMQEFSAPKGFYWNEFVKRNWMKRFMTGIVIHLQHYLSIF